MNRLLLEKTIDGSYTIFVPELNEHYHSVNGAIQESQHVFINAGFEQVCHRKNISILEIGFGTGLNAFLTLLNAEKKEVNIYYTSFELYPLPMDIINQLNYTDKISEVYKPLFLSLHEKGWDEQVSITSSFYLKKIGSDINHFDRLSKSDLFDLIYFDAFAPEKQPEMWTQNLFDYLFSHTNKKGVLVTYCAKGCVRRMMQQAGYIVERIPGPPGKREMLRAQKI